MNVTRPRMLITAVCRTKTCGGGGWWGELVPTRCPRCGKETMIIDRTAVVAL